MAVLVPPKFTPPVSDKMSPQEMAIHLRQLYLITNQHDQAIVTVNGKVTTTTTTVASTVTTSVAGVTSFNSLAGAISYFPSLGFVNDQSGQVAYAMQSTDNGGLVVLNDAAPIAITLNSTIPIPWFGFLYNAGAGTATLTPTSGNVNNVGSVSAITGSSVVLFFDGTDWWALLSGTGGGGSVPSFADDETPAGLINGINLAYTLAHAPNPVGSLILSLGGLVQNRGGGNDYTLAGTNITFTAAPALGPLLAWYRY